eukprot:437853-Rhodomonas_salina.2
MLRSTIGSGQVQEWCSGNQNLVPPEPSLLKAVNRLDVPWCEKKVWHSRCRLERVAVLIQKEVDEDERLI